MKGDTLPLFWCPSSTAPPWSWICKDKKAWTIVYMKPNNLITTAYIVRIPTALIAHSIYTQSSTYQIAHFTQLLWVEYIDYDNVFGFLKQRETDIFQRGQTANTFIQTWGSSALKINTSLNSNLYHAKYKENMIWPFFSFFSSSSVPAPSRVKMIPVWELTPTAVTTIRPDPSITWVPVKWTPNPLKACIIIEVLHCLTWKFPSLSF